MSTRDYIKNKEGLQKVRQLVVAPKVVMLATKLDKIPFAVCPMTLLQMDEQGDLWFFMSKESEHFKDITYDNRVQILYSDEIQNKYISIYGNATHMVDEKKMKELWNPIMSKWFDGKDDDCLALLNVNMENAYYWDSDLNKPVSFFNLVDNKNNDENQDKNQKGFIDLQSY
ncbi:MAG: pyridoxamine 5'-phosphate oxidase family protein [Xanthomarina sp.]